MVDLIAVDDNKTEYRVQTIPSSETMLNQVLDKFWQVYKGLSGWALVEKTHERNTPWSQVYVEGQDIEITQESMTEHFRQKINEYIGSPK